MPLSPADLAIRKTRLSATDIGAIIGVNPWRSAADVRAEKLYDLDPITEDESIGIGNMVEPVLLDWAAKELRCEIERPIPTTVHPVHDFLCATPDAQIVAKLEGIEGKTAGIVRGQVDAGEWGEAGSDDVPAAYKVQCLVQMSVMDWQVVHLAALIAGRGRVLYRIERSEEDIEGIIDIARKWLDRHVVLAEPCIDSAGNVLYPSMELLKRIRRQPDNPREVPAALVEAWKVAREVRLDAEKVEESAKEALIGAMGDGDGASIGGTCVATFLEQSRKDIDRDKLAMKYPEVFEDCRKNSAFRVLRSASVKARKGGKREAI